MKTKGEIHRGWHYRKFGLGMCMALLTVSPLTNISAQSIVIGPNIPHDIDRKPPSDAYQVELAQFAWQQFVAMGWKATYDPANKNYERGKADAKWDGKGVPDYVVWETYAHRSELRPWGVPLTANFSSLPNYLTQVRKEGKLKQGTDSAGNEASLTLLNNLDEDNEIGSCDIYLGALANPTTQPLVLYQAKVNQDEYDYVKTVFGADQFDPKGSLAKAATNNMSNIKAIKAYFKGPDGKPDFNTCAPPKNVAAASTITLPCGKIGGREGAIEIKTAFYQIPKGEEAKFANFFVRDAIYYTEGLKPDGTGDGTYTYNNAKFALLGMHIIHKTTNFPDFIFTSFEHKDLASMDFGFKLLSPLPAEYPGSNFNPHGAVVKPPNAGDGTQIGELVKIVRQTGPNPTRKHGQLYPIPSQFAPVNASAQKQLAAVGSIWQNYQLIGVQALITESYAASPKGIAGPNHFMANHVIESDAFLGNFFGPGFSSLPNPPGPVFPTGKKGPDGSQNGDNLLYQGKTYNMGGCKGCHGVAQTAFGTDFSFLLDFGAGKPVAEPDTIFYVRPPLKTK